MSEEPNRPNCNKCRHYFVTYDPKLPHGCRSFNFKSRQLPCVHVREVSGEECQVFSAKSGHH